MFLVVCFFWRGRNGFFDKTIVEEYFGSGKSNITVLTLPLNFVTSFVTSDEDFRDRIGNRIEEVCGKLGVEVAYAFQEMDMFVDSIPEGRVKPWGTGHAELCAADQIDGSFAVINADDYYGKDGFRKAAYFLLTGRYALFGYVLRNTLSENGGVTSGVCSVEDGKLVSIAETKNIVKTEDGAEADGVKLDIDSLVSMNFWCYSLEFIDVLRKGFPEFISRMKDPLKDEYLHPIIADGMLKQGVEFEVLPSDDMWFGVTYQEDKESVMESFRALYAAGEYGQDL